MTTFQTFFKFLKKKLQDYLIYCVPWRNKFFEEDDFGTVRKTIQHTLGFSFVHSCFFNLGKNLLFCSGSYSVVQDSSSVLTFFRKCGSCSLSSIISAQINIFCCLFAVLLNFLGLAFNKYKRFNFCKLREKVNLQKLLLFSSWKRRIFAA